MRGGREKGERKKKREKRKKKGNGNGGKKSKMGKKKKMKREMEIGYAPAVIAGCTGQGRHARLGARARGQWRVRPALIAVGGRAMRRWRGKRESARYDRRKRKGDIDEWHRESGIGCSGQRKDFQNLGFRF